MKDLDMEDVHTSKLLTWYNSLPARRVDLVGDYAGEELFVIEGDSILLECFQEPGLDFDDGFQLLHAVYRVERFLQQLVVRKCNFHVVFFRKHQGLCIPADTQPINRSKFLLAREVIIQHLIRHHKAIQPVRVYRFETLSDPIFRTYLDRESVYFVLCHDGASPASKTPSQNPHQNPAFAYASQRDDDVADPKKLLLRGMILQVMQARMNVALMNGLEWRDTKVMVQILDSKTPLSKEAHETTTSEYAQAQQALSSVCASANHAMSQALIGGVRATGPPSLGLCEDRRERDWLSILVLRNLLSQDKERADLVVSFLLHTVLMGSIPLSRRRIDITSLGANGIVDDSRSAKFLSSFASGAAAVAHDLNWNHAGSMKSYGDIADMVDGRLFKACAHLVARGQMAEKLSSSTRMELVRYADAVDAKEALQLLLGRSSVGQTTPSLAATGPAATLAPGKEYPALPFSNPVFDKHLASVKLAVDAKAPGPQGKSAKIFQELSHWHSAKKKIGKPPAPRTARDKFRLLRSHQFYMSEMTAYAASLTNAAGKFLEPETIVVNRSKKDAKGDVGGKLSIGNRPSSKGPVEKKQGNKKGKNTVRDEIAAQMLKKESEEAKKVVSAWTSKRTSLDAIKDPTLRFRSTQDYLRDLPAAKRKFLEAEILLYMLQILMSIWSEYCRVEKKTDGAPTAALACKILLQLAEGPSGMTQAIATEVGKMGTSLGVPLKDFKPKAARHSFQFNDRASEGRSGLDLSLPMSWTDFQLLHCGPYLVRNMDSAPDPRVTFEPDGWQRKVLDELDLGRSIFVVAPTSAGKTFISFYAMEQVLRRDDEGVLVYVAPTKALVNQIAAEIQARFQKSYPGTGKSVWAIHTKDYRINNPTGCQILVTVPHILQIMLLAPSNARSWSPRVRRIIFDEIHCIGQADDGVVWEQLLLLAPCPIIALSATVGNPEQFSDWLRSTQQAMGQELTMITHAHRYSDLRKFIYQSPSEFAFTKLSEKPTVARHDLDQAPGFAFVHPMNALVKTARGVPDDLALEARDCHTLWQAMKKHQPLVPWASDELSDPAKALPAFIQKADIIKWETALKAEVRQWIRAYPEMLQKVVQELSCSQALADHRLIRATKSNTPEPTEAGEEMSSFEDLRQNTLPLLSALHDRGALPAILFNYDRGKCEDIARSLMLQLSTAESTWKENDRSWQLKIEGWENWKKLQAKKPAKPSSKKGRGQEDGDEPRSKTTSLMDAASNEVDPFETFDPEAPVEGFHFADHKRLLKAELNEYIRQLKRKNIAEWLVECLKRGIGVHHAGMNRKYRQVVEILFRKRFLRVVVATGTLALGINMPCATVVFSGDSVFLTALNFRQAAGRAGRRGFDLLGNVVFHNISYDKVCRLLSSRLPDLNGHFPVTTTLILRLFSLLHNSDYSPYATKAIHTLLSQPRLYLGGQSFKDQVTHHLRFSIEFLRRQDLLGSNGAPLNFAGCISHLYFTENSSFAFHTLLREGYFHELCATIRQQPEACLKTLIIVMANLFGRRPCRQADQEFIDVVVKRSPSVVFLPPLPSAALEVLRRYNQETLKIFSGYVRTFVDQHITADDARLPFTQWNAHAECAIDETPLPLLPPTKTRSAFVALSGHGDTFMSISDLCETARDGIFLEKAVIPHAELYPDESNTPLNAYIYDFYMHGDITALEKANGVRKSDVWYLLNDFSMVLATIVTSLTNFMKLTAAGDADLVDIVGQGDELDIEKDEALANEVDISAEALKLLADTPTPPPRAGKASRKKVAVVDAWDDPDEDDDAEADDGTGTSSNGLEHFEEAAGTPAWEQGGLRNVLLAFEKLQTEFNERFRVIWA